MLGNKSPKTLQPQLQANDRQLRALELRKAGWGYDQIAEECGYRDRSGAYRAVARALKATLREPAADVRRLEVERLDALLKGLWTAASQGDNYAIDRALKIMDRRAALLGLDAPRRVAVADLSTEQIIGLLGEAIEDGVSAAAARASEPGDPPPTRTLLPRLDE